MSKTGWPWPRGPVILTCDEMPQCTAQCFPARGSPNHKHSTENALSVHLSKTLGGLIQLSADWFSSSQLDMACCGTVQLGMAQYGLTMATLLPVPTRGTTPAGYQPVTSLPFAKWHISTLWRWSFCENQAPCACDCEIKWDASAGVTLHWKRLPCFYR